MALTTNQLAQTVARSGAARCAATRMAFAPRDTRNSAGTADGPLYTWSRVYPAATTWTSNLT